MFGKKKNISNEIDNQKINELVLLSKKTIKILYLLLIVIGVYAIIKLTKEIKIIEFLLIILKTIAPLFIGFFIAWLFDPLVKFLQKKGLRRSFGTIVTYVLLLGIFALIMGGLIPLLSEQLNEFIKVIPGIIDSAKGLIDQVLGRLSVIDGLDTESLKNPFALQISICSNVGFVSWLTSSNLSANLFKSSILKS